MPGVDVSWTGEVEESGDRFRSQIGGRMVVTRSADTAGDAWSAQ